MADYTEKINDSDETVLNGCVSNFKKTINNLFHILR